MDPITDSDVLKQLLQTIAHAERNELESGP